MGEKKKVSWCGNQIMGREERVETIPANDWKRGTGTGIVLGRTVADGGKRKSI